MPFGVISLVLALWHFVDTPKPRPLEPALAPFSSMSELLGTRRRVPSFLKRRYPGHLAKRRIRHPLVEMSMELPSHLVMGLMWMMFAPTPLLFQCLPETNSRLTAKMP